MKLKALVLALAMMIAGAMVNGSAYAVECPAGSLRNPDGTGGTANTYAECNLPEPVAGEKTLMQTVQTIINVVVGVLGVVAVAVIVVGGILFVVSTGESAKVARAKNTILYGVVGLVVALLAFAIVNFVLGSVFGGGAATPAAPAAPVSV